MSSVYSVGTVPFYIIYSFGKNINEIIKNIKNKIYASYFYWKIIDINILSYINCLNSEYYTKS